MRWSTAIVDFIRARRPQESLGERGERIAARYLKRLGYKIIAQRHRDSLGELDLVAVDGRTVVFVEVKTRRSDMAGHPADAVDEEKQRRLTRLAVSYLKQHDLLEERCRFDVVAVTWPDDGQPAQVEHFQHAFPAVGQPSLFS